MADAVYLVRFSCARPVLPVLAPPNQDDRPHNSYLTRAPMIEMTGGHPGQTDHAGEWHTSPRLREAEVFATREAAEAARDAYFLRDARNVVVVPVGRAKLEAEVRARVMYGTDG